MKIKIPIIGGLIVFGIILTFIIPSFTSISEEKQSDKMATYQINAISKNNHAIDQAKFFIKKNNEWFNYGSLDDEPYWTNVGKLEYKDGAIFEQIPDITDLAIQYYPSKNFQITNITGNGNYTTNFDIDGDSKPDIVFIRQVTWDHSLPKQEHEYRTQSIIANVESSPIKPSMQVTKTSIQSIIDIEKKYPDLLTDEEVDILLSQAIGKSYGFTDLEVDAQTEKIMWKIVNYFKGD